MTYCPKHPGSSVWRRKLWQIPEAGEVDTCAACGEPFDESLRLALLTEKPEPVTVRSFAYYRECASRTDDKGLNTPGCAMGLAGEAGELIDALKKTIYHGHVFDRAKLLNECGDVLWYLDRLAFRLGFTLDQAATENIRKLQKRYPDGFSEERSRNREDAK